MSMVLPSASSAPGPVPNHLVWAIAVTVLSFFVCCLSCISILGVATGIVAIVYASKVNNLLVQEQFDAALLASRNAKIWAWVTTGILIAGALLFVANFVMVGGVEGYREQLEQLRQEIEAAKGG